MIFFIHYMHFYADGAASPSWHSDFWFPGYTLLRVHNQSTPPAPPSNLYFAPRWRGSPWNWVSAHRQGRNHGWKVLRGTKVWAPTPGRLRPAPGQRPGWRWVREGVAPSRCGGSGGVTHGKFLKTQMLNPVFWWLLLSMVGSRTCIMYIRENDKHVKG